MKKTSYDRCVNSLGAEASQATLARADGFAKPAGAMELLAPAGSLESFDAAINAGASAIYIGAPGVNARALCKDFSPEEVAAMVKHAHGRGVKLYVAMNSLIKDEELAEVFVRLAMLVEIGIDALIIQDLGLYALCRRFFPNLRLHASTLMGAHNSLAVSQLAGMGFSRVVLARELSLAEIRLVAEKNKTVELEAFVHGAMCFSYSGLCLISSYLGGKSGLRGRCVQPCRRRYHWADKQGKGGYLFSMNDLDALNLLPELKAAGLSSLKIEGRMKSAHYVGKVVSAYRLALNTLYHEPSGFDKCVRECGDILGEAMGRKSSSGFFVNNHKDNKLVSPEHSGNSGLFLGRVKTVKGNWVSLGKPAGKVERGDRLRWHREENGERLAFTVKELKAIAGKDCSTQEIKLPGVARKGDSLYQLDLGERRRKAGRKKSLEIDRWLKEKLLAIRKKALLLADSKEFSIFLGPSSSGRQKKGLANHLATSNGSRRARGGKGGKAFAPIWIKLAELKQLRQVMPYEPERLVLPLEPGSVFLCAEAMTKLKKLRAKIVWALPPVMLEADLPFYREKIAALIKQGFAAWMLGHFSQRGFFPENNDDLLVAGYTVNIANRLALDSCLELGMAKTLLAIENDSGTTGRIASARQGLAGLVAYARPPLFISKAHCSHFRYRKTFLSPRGEEFELRESFGQCIALAKEPFSLFPFISTLSASPPDFLFVDLSYLSIDKNQLFTLLSATPKKLQGRVNTFNFRHQLA